MRPSDVPDRVFELLATPDPGRLAFRVAVGTHNLRVGELPVVGDEFRDARCQVEKARVDEFGGYVLTRIEQGPPGYLWLYYAPDDADDGGPWRVVPGNGRHYEWPRVVKGFGVVEDPYELVPLDVSQSSQVRVPRLLGRWVIHEAAFALCRTELRFYLSARPFEVGQYEQPVPGELSWVLQGQEGRMVALHGDLTLPAAGRAWNLKYGEGIVRGLPSEAREFPATVMRDWQPFVVGYRHGQTESGMWELVEEWIFPPVTGRLMDA
jgi:hypothetical protein